MRKRSKEWENEVKNEKENEKKKKHQMLVSKLLLLLFHDVMVSQGTLLLVQYQDE